MPPFLSVVEEMEGVPMDKGMRGGLLGIEEVFSELTILSCPDPGEDLYMYLIVSKHAMNAVLLKNQEGTQRPIYYINKMLVDAETIYLPLKKLALALVHATRKLPHYFQAHTVYVLMEYPSTIFT